ncbi:two-component sensor histidine kinase BarA [Ferrimonas sp. SCSIO 43195]|uniref:two-component sensor histidine kinase BarA n=1 Tax=Ferrimonas sp. SCSIO 43195 TaxID=2822844 RepID=UPI002074D587|nr:two-component sensor histidine kinase BarA [Ferrimonas sp. SCSIO 43195]USD38517.1 two-component sensor histidine kinase BarA [Ferrimonas sp. SCSIO 43195]
MNGVTKYSLRAWVLVLALAPTILIGVLLGSFFTLTRFSELDHSLLVRGKNIVSPLAMAASYGLSTSNRDYSQRLIDMIHKQNSLFVQLIAIFDNQNQVFATSQYRQNFDLIKLPINRDLTEGINIEHIGDHVIMRAPIYTLPTPAVDTNFTPRTQLGYIVLQINKHEALVSQYRGAGWAFIIVLIGVQLNLLFTFRLMKNVTRPITDMVTAVAKIREGKLDTRLQGELIGELDHLKRGINAMASSLAEYHNEMQQNIDQATSDLRETLEQIEIQNVELDIAKKRALEASRVKSEFMANMSHELRTPLNGVIGFTRQLLKTPLHDNQRDYLNTIERSATNLLSIINDILDFSKLEAGKMVLEKMPFALREAVDETMQLLSTAAAEKELELVIDIDERVPDSLNGDVMRLQQILTNLVNNAIKFTDKGSVRLQLDAAKETPERVLIRGEVADTGIGISKEQQSMLFQAFGQADSSISRRFGGTGLGLVITKRLVNHMDGQIGFTSSEGQGSTFWFTLSIEKSPFTISDPLILEQVYGQSALVFEPRLLTRNNLVQQLDSWHIKATACGSSSPLQQHLNGQHYNHALIAWRKLKPSDGMMETLSVIRNHCDNLVLLLDSNNSEVANQMAGLGIDHCLTLPMSERRLFASLTNKDAQHLPAPQLPMPLGRDKKALKTLAVDDNRANLKLIDTLLSELVEEVDTLSSGTQAIQRAQEQEYDIIFMDIQMPDIDGIQATQRIRQQSRNTRTPIIAVTAHLLGAEREQVLASGIDDILTKPIDEEGLEQVIDRWTSTASPVLTQVVDWELALTQSGGNNELAKEMLKMLMDSIPETRELIDNHLQLGDRTAMLKTVHKLHGATCYSGVPGLQKLCADLESQLKQGNSTAQLEPEILELLDELNKVESAAETILAA